MHRQFSPAPERPRGERSACWWSNGGMDSPRCFVGARAIVVTLATLLLIANGAGASAASAAALSSAGPSVVTNCTSAQGRAPLASFVSAFSAVEYRRLNRLFAAPAWF